MSDTNPPAGPFIFGLSARSIENLNVAAVTGSPEGGEKRKPLRIVKVYVLPSFERLGTEVATSGWSSEPPGAGAAGYWRSRPGGPPQTGGFT
jgi:hypothetical protein